MRVPRRARQRRVEVADVARQVGAEADAATSTDAPVGACSAAAIAASTRRRHPSCSAVAFHVFAAELEPDRLREALAEESARLLRSEATDGETPNRTPAGTRENCPAEGAATPESAAATSRMARNAPRRRRATRTVRGILSPFPGIFHPSEYDRPVQKYVLSELDSGERVISERVPSVRSVVPRLLDRRGLTGRDRSQGRLSHFIEHLLFKGSERFDAQEIAETFDGARRRTERRDLPRAHRRLRPRAGQAPRDRRRRDERHGLRAALRGRRLRARGRPRGDRDVRGHTAGARARPLLRGGVRLAPARPAGDRHARGDRERPEADDHRLPPLDVHAGEHRDRGCGQPPARPARPPPRAGAAQRARRRGRACARRS